MPKFKAQIRIPTEQFAYIELEVEDTAENIVLIHYDFLRMVKPKVGIPDKEYNDFVDRYLLGEKNHVEVYQLMSPEQQTCVQTIKRSLARIKAKQEKQ